MVAVDLMHLVDFIQYFVSSDKFVCRHDLIECCLYIMHPWVWHCFTLERVLEDVLEPSRVNGSEARQYAIVKCFVASCVFVQVQISFEVLGPVDHGEHDAQTKLILSVFRQNTPGIVQHADQFVG